MLNHKPSIVNHESSIANHKSSLNNYQSSYKYHKVNVKAEHFTRSLDTTRAFTNIQLIHGKKWENTHANKKHVISWSPHILMRHVAPYVSII